MYLNASNNSQSQFNNLPSHLVIEICSYLDNESQLSALIAFDQWTSAFESSSKLMDKFKLNLNEAFFNKHRVQELPHIAVKNVKISSDIWKPSSYPDTLKKYSESIVNLEFSHTYVDNPYFAMLLEAVKNVTHLELDWVQIYVDRPIELPKLKNLKISPRYYEHFENGIMKQWMTNFKNNQSIEKLHLDGNVEQCYFSPDDVNSFISTLPILKHLIINYRGIGEPLDAHFPAKLETLEVYKFKSDNSIDFLRTQMETLKDLKISNFGYHKMMNLKGDIMQVIFNEMNLRNFQCKDDKVIVNYERQLQFEPYQFEYFEPGYDTDYDFYEEDDF